MPREYDVWSEGYRCTGDAAPACLHGSVRADSFRQACDLLLGHDPNYDPERLDYWGCRLFDTEEQARASFG